MALWSALARVFTRRDPAARGEAERILLEADFGMRAVTALLERLDGARDGELATVLEREVAAVLAGPADPGRVAAAATPPTVIVVCGVNGVGKTTTVAKLAHRLGGEGRRVLLAAADTFRAGAVSQLRIWAERLGVPFVGPAADGTGDAAAVAYDAVAAAAARGVDTVLIDTAGRLHTERRLLEELQKIVRVVAKPHPAHDAPHETLLVLDATVGQTAVHQAVAFAGAVPLTGLIVTKLDGTARGGAVVAVRGAVPVPIRFVGTGEGLADLAVFDAAAYARRLVTG